VELSSEAKASEELVRQGGDPRAAAVSVCAPRPWRRADGCVTRSDSSLTRSYLSLARGNQVKATGDPFIHWSALVAAGELLAVGEDGAEQESSRRRERTADAWPRGIAPHSIAPHSNPSNPQSEEGASLNPPPCPDPGGIADTGQQEKGGRPC